MGKKGKKKGEDVNEGGRLGEGEWEGCVRVGGLGAK